MVISLTQPGPSRNCLSFPRPAHGEVDVYFSESILSVVYFYVLLWDATVSTLITVFLFYCILFIQVCLRYLVFCEVCGLSAYFVEGGGRMGMLRKWKKVFLRKLDLEGRI